MSHKSELIATDIDAYLARHRDAGLLLALAKAYRGESFSKAALPPAPKDDEESKS